MKEVYSSCGCHSYKFPRLPIAPGVAGFITSTYNSNGRPGIFNKPLSVVISNSLQTTMILQVRGYVKGYNDSTTIHYECPTPKINPEYTDFKKPQIKFLETEHCFGSVYDTAAVCSYVYKFVNTGNAPLLLTDVKTACGCDYCEWPRNAIQPNDTGEVIYYYYAKGRAIEKPNKDSKSAYVFSNAANESFILLRNNITIIPHDDSITKPDPNCGCEK